MSIEMGVALLLIAACWAVAPAIICERMLRALDFGRGRGLIIGCMLGPLGVAAVNIYVSLQCLSPNHARRGTRPQPPLAARLREPDRKFSMGGDLLAFVCLWAVILLSSTLLPFDKSRQATHPPNSISQTSLAPMQEVAATVSQVATTAATPSVESLSSQPFKRTPQQDQAISESQKLTLLSEARPVTPPSASSSETNAAPGSTPSPAQPDSNTSAQPTGTGAAGSVGAVVPQAKPSGMSAGELMRLVVPSNFKAHGTVSGGGRTTTLTIVCAECTYELATGRLRNAGTRATIKAAGVRVVVLMNGQDSWTFML
ncbi:MAG TPA: hypothetical protein VGW12_19120 [Pyrinomonadaceae bacterium]|nr:hypothetical protein [Pyrinomonadaceae bacterium]